MTTEEKAFCRAVRDYYGLSVVGEGTRPVRIRAYPRGSDWQGWYGVGRTRVGAYISLIRVMCLIPANQGERDWTKVVEDCRIAAKKMVTCESSTGEANQTL